MARKQSQPWHLFFEDTLIEHEEKYPTHEERENVLDGLLEYYRPIDKHHPSAILKIFHSSYLLSTFLDRPEFAHFSEYLRVWNEGRRLIYNDDKDAFASFLDTNRGIIEKLPPIAFLDSICSFSAVGCATVLFANMDMNFQEQSCKCELCIYSLYDAVTVPSPSVEIIKLFLKYGANPDTWPYSSLPIASVLQNLSLKIRNRDWTSEKSIYKLFYLFCLPELEETLEIIKLLASHMKLVERVLSDLIETGLFVELIGLLIAARDQLLVSSAKDGALVNTSAGKYIMSELRKESEVLDPSKFPKKLNLMIALNLVNTLWKCIDVLHTYRVSKRAKSVSKDQVPFDIAADIISNTELVLDPSDVYCKDIDCLRPKHAIEAQGVAKIMCCSRNFRRYATILGPGFSSELKRSFSTTTKKMRALTLYSPSWISSSSDNMKHAEFQLSKTTQMKPSMCNVSASIRVCTSLIQIAKRSFR